MTILELPQINFDSTPGYNEWKFLHQIYSQEFYLRSLIGCTPGIVDTTADPTVAPLTTARPLFVSNNSANTQTLDITAGYAITPNHQLIVIDSNLSGIPLITGGGPLPASSEDTIYVVMVEYALVPSVDVQRNRFNVLAELRDERPSNTPYGAQVGVESTLTQAVTVATLADYNNISIFPQDRKNGLVVIAIAVVRADAVTGQLEVLLDLTRTTFPYNRPWFSPVDITHRSQIGSGVVTENNPHALSVQDLSSSGFTLYQQLLPRGGVFAKDLTYYGYPGTFCTELVSLNRYQTDDTGEITSDPSLQLDPLTGRYFVTLTKVPVRMGSLYFQGTPWKPVPYFWKPGTRYLILGTLEQPLTYGSSLTVEYFSVSALMPPQESLTQGVQSFTVTDPTAGVEYIISGGLTLDTLTNATLNLSATLGPIKKAYQVICNTDGTLVTSPQNLVPVLQVPDLVTEGQITINQAPLNGVGVTWVIGLTGAPNTPPSSSASSNLNLQLLVNGVNENGSTVEETITFYASQWAEQDPTELVEQPLQFRTTANKYQLVNYVRLLNTTATPDNAGNAAILSLWANILESSSNQELANVASFFWDGLGARRVTDTRVVSTSLQRDDQRELSHPNLMPETSAAFVQELFSVIFEPPLVDPSLLSNRLALEMNDDRSVGETWKVFSDLDASGTIEVVDFSLVTPGMTLRVADGKVLTFVTTPPVPDPTVGEVGIPTSLLTGNIELQNNIVTTVNNATFDSTWFAALGTTNVSLTRTQAYPDGFAVCARQRMVFNQAFTAGTITFSVAGVTIGPVAFTTSHSVTLDAIVQAVYNVSSTTGVTAVRVVSSPLDYLVFNGPIDGSNFIVTTPVFVGGPLGIAATVSAPPDAFIIGSPTNGTLPTPHLPDRFVSNERPWEYISRAIQWTGVGLQATIAFTGNTTTAIQDGDQVEIVPGKILFARRGSPSPSITRSLGQFLVTVTGSPAADLLATLESMRDTVNDPAFASGCHAEVDSTNTKLLINIGGYAAAEITLLVESTTNTWLITPYTPSGIGSAGSTGMLKAVYPLASAEWRYQLIQPAATVGTFTSSNVNITPNTIRITAHGLFNGDAVFFTTTGLPPSGLLANQTYYVINETANDFQLALSPGGSVITLIDGGSGVATLYVAQPYGPGEWSPYFDMHRISPSAFSFKGPGASSIYAVQVKLKGETGQPNTFSLYQVTPETGATNIALDARLTLLDQGTPATGLTVGQGEITTARGTSANLNARLSQTINPDGTRIQDPELLNGRNSAILPPATNLKNRLDTADGLSYWLTGSADNYLVPTAMGNKGIPNQIVSGPIQNYTNVTTIGAAKFIDYTGTLLRITATNADPLVVSVNGRYYRFAREIDLDFAASSAYGAGTFYINAEIRSISTSFFPAAVTTASNTVSIPAHGFVVGDPVKFSNVGGGLPAPLLAGVTYYVNTIARSSGGLTVPDLFTVAATRGGATIDITTQGTGTHTVTLVEQELGPVVFSGYTTSAITAGGNSLTSTSSNFNNSLGTPSYAMDDLLVNRSTPLVVWMPTINSGNGSFFSPVAAKTSSTAFTIKGQFPTVPFGTYFEVRSPQECSFTVTPFVGDNFKFGTDVIGTKSATRLPIGQAGWNGTSAFSSSTFNFQYQDHYISDVSGVTGGGPIDVTSVANYTSLPFPHNLGRLPGAFKLYYHTSASGDSNPVLVEGDAIFSVSTNAVVVKNRYTLSPTQGLIVKDFSGANKTIGYLQLVIS